MRAAILASRRARLSWCCRPRLRTRTTLPPHRCWTWACRVRCGFFCSVASPSSASIPAPSALCSAPRRARQSGASRTRRGWRRRAISPGPRWKRSPPPVRGPARHWTWRCRQAPGNLQSARQRKASQTQVGRSRKFSPSRSASWTRYSKTVGASYFRQKDVRFSWSKPTTPCRESRVSVKASTMQLAESARWKAKIEAKPGSSSRESGTVVASGGGPTTTRLNLTMLTAIRTENGATAPRAGWTLSGIPSGVLPRSRRFS